MSEPRDVPPVIGIEHATKRFGDFVAVDDVSFAIPRGEFFSMLGPSGCGKTTMLRMIAGFETLSAGTLRIDGSDMPAVPPYRRPVNTVFQNYALFPQCLVNGWDDIGLTLRRQDAIRAYEERRRASEPWIFS